MLTRSLGVLILSRSRFFLQPSTFDPQFWSDWVHIHWNAGLIRPDDAHQGGGIGKDQFSTIKSKSQNYLATFWKWMKYIVLFALASALVVLVL